MGARDGEGGGNWVDVANASSAAEIATLREENARLREMLAIAYAGASLYVDDGELQGSRTGIDFRRDTVEEIRRKQGEYTQATLSGFSLRGAWLSLEQLRQIEWGLITEDEEGQPHSTCTVCGAHYCDDHAPDCWLGNLLKAGE